MRMSGFNFEFVFYKQLDLRKESQIKCIFNLKIEFSASDLVVFSTNVPGCDICFSFSPTARELRMKVHSKCGKKISSKYFKKMQMCE